MAATMRYAGSILLFLAFMSRESPPFLTVSLPLLLVLAVLAGAVRVAPCQMPTTQDNVFQGCLASKSGALVLNDGEGDAGALLKGNTAGLASHIGDELSVTGEMSTAPQGSATQKVLTVSSYTVLFTTNPNGVQPQTSAPGDWTSFRSAKFGAGVQFPKGWSRPANEEVDVWSNFVTQQGVQTLVVRDVPKTTYPGSNFLGGHFALYVAPSIQDAGACRQFETTDGGTSRQTVNGISWAEAKSTDAAMTDGEIVYAAHTFRNGYCYELALEFDEANGNGRDLMCTTQWLTSANEHKLLTALLSQVSFAEPRVRNAIRQAPGLPTVTTFREFPLSGRAATRIGISWTTRGTDYVQLRRPCVHGLYAAGTSAPGMETTLSSALTCGPVTHSNYPPNGSGAILLSNFNAKAVPFVLTLVPFRGGKACLKGAKTITVNTPPTPGLVHAQPPSAP